MSQDVTQSDRQRRAQVVSVILSVLVVVAIAAVGFLFVRSVSARLAAARNIDRATSLLKSVDTDVVAIDAAVRSKLDSNTAETKDLSSRRIPRAKEQLDSAVALIDAAYPRLNDDEREQAVALKATAEARLAMLRFAAPILLADQQAMRSLANISKGWDELLEAKSLSRQAAVEYNKLSKASVTASSRLLQRANAKLSGAKAAFTEGTDNFPSLDVKPYWTYLTTLVQLNQLAIRSNSAWLQGKTAVANTYTTRYNILEKQAVVQANALPASPQQVVANAVERATSADLRHYVEARKKATQADERLRTR